MAEYEGQSRPGVVTRVDMGGQQKVAVETADQEFWYEPQHLFPIPLSEEWLIRLKFSKETDKDGTVKYAKGPFRIVIKQPGDFNDITIWYREDVRHWKHNLHVHELQNHYLQMTKVPLSDQLPV